MAGPAPDSTLNLVMQLAAADAGGSGSHQVRSFHVLHAYLCIADRIFEEDARALGAGSGVISAAAATESAIRSLLGLSDAALTKTRRQLRRACPRRALAASGTLPCSRTVVAALDAAASEAAVAGSSSVSAASVLRALLRLRPTEALVASAGATPTASVNDTPAAPKDDLGVVSRDLTALARGGRLAPVVGRRAEVKSLARHLQRTTKRNVLLIGEPGVGKTAVVEGFAIAAAHPAAPDFLRRLRVLQIEVSDLVAGTVHRGEMEARMRTLLDACARDEGIVLFLDEIHLIMQAGAAGAGALDVANILKPALARGDIRCIGATTTDEFERHITTDGALLRRFQLLRVAEPTVDASIEMCTEWARRIERLQEVSIDRDAVDAAVRLSARLVTTRALPDKAIDLLENAATAAKVSSLTFEAAAPVKGPVIVLRRHIEAALLEMHGIAPSAEELLQPLAVEAELRRSVVGQDHAIFETVAALEMLAARGDSGHTMGVLSFVGPVGSGRTQTAHAVSRAAFGGPAFQFNLAELSERHDLSRLVGAPPGFVGHDRPGTLFEFTQRHAQGVVVFNGWSDTHDTVRAYLQGIWGAGRANDSRGREVSLRRYLFVVIEDSASESAASAIGFRPPALTPRPQMDDLPLRPWADAVIRFTALDDAGLAELLRRRLVALAADIEARHGVELGVKVTPSSLVTLWAANTPRRLVGEFDRTLAAPVLSTARGAERGDLLDVRLVDAAIVVTNVTRQASQNSVPPSAQYRCQS